MHHLWKSNSSDAQDSTAGQDEAEFSLDRYEPMANLLSEADLLFLKSQPGYSPEIGRKFSRERRRIFRLYLRELERDFNRLHACARSIVGSLEAEHAPLVGLLLRQQIRFWYEMSAVEVRLSLSPLVSWTGVAIVDARRLVDALRMMQVEINALAAPSAA